MFSKTRLLVMLVGIFLIAVFPSFAEDDMQSGYVDVNGLHMYYEIHGSGEPLLLLHGAYMAIPIMSDLIKPFAETRQLIVVELQGHGRTADIDRPFSYELMADDVAAFMDAIEIKQADIMGYSMGGNIALQLAIRHPDYVNKLVLVSAAYNSTAYDPGFFEMLDMLTPELFAGSPVEADYMSLAPEPDFPRLVEKLVQLDKEVQDWSAEDLQAIQSPTFVIIGDSDVVRPEHAIEMFRLFGGGVNGDLAGLPKARLAILPASSHIGVLFRVDWLVAMVTEFLDTPVSA